jgi:hypothetical protein
MAKQMLKVCSLNSGYLHGLHYTNTIISIILWIAIWTPLSYECKKLNMWVMLEINISPVSLQTKNCLLVLQCPCLQNAYTLYPPQVLKLSNKLLKQAYKFTLLDGYGQSRLWRPLYNLKNKVYFNLYCLCAIA